MDKIQRLKSAVGEGYGTFHYDKFCFTQGLTVKTLVNEFQLIMMVAKGFMFPPSSTFWTSST